MGAECTYGDVDKISDLQYNVYRKSRKFFSAWVLKKKGKDNGQ